MWQFQYLKKFKGPQERTYLYTTQQHNFFHSYKIQYFIIIYLVPS